MISVVLVESSTLRKGCGQFIFVVCERYWNALIIPSVKTNNSLNIYKHCLFQVLNVLCIENNLELVYHHIIHLNVFLPCNPSPHPQFHQQCLLACQICHVRRYPCQISNTILAEPCHTGNQSMMKDSSCRKAIFGTHSFLFVHINLDYQIDVIWILNDSRHSSDKTLL